MLSILPGRFVISLIACGALLSGCSANKSSAVALHPPTSAFTGLVVLDAVSVINTHKTVEDHLVSLISGEDCSSVRASKGDYYCIDDTPPKTNPRISYCYKSIAAVSCFDRRLASDSSRLYGSRVDMVPVEQP